MPRLLPQGWTAFPWSAAAHKPHKPHKAQGAQAKEHASGGRRGRERADDAHRSSRGCYAPFVASRWVVRALGSLGVAAGCSGALEPTAVPVPPAPTARVPASPSAGGALEDASLGAPDATTRDATPDAPLVASAALRVSPRHGAPSDDDATPAGPGIVLDGGFGGAAVRAWMHTTATGGASARGDLVLLTASAGDSAAAWLTSAPFRSAQTIALADGATDADLRIAAALVRRAEVVWFTGGDQAAYVRWKGTPLMAAVQAVFDRGGVVGGTSAGMILLGSSVNDAFYGPSENILTAAVVADPYDSSMHFTQNVLRLPPLARTITDPHFLARDRLGRLVVFMARQVKEGFASPDILGVGVDDGAALVIGPDGRGRRLASGDGPGVYVLRGGAPERVVAGQPLVYRGLRLLKLSGATHVFDFKRRCGRGGARTFDVDGAASPPYLAEAYEDGPVEDDCP